MNERDLDTPIRSYADINRLLLSRVRDDPRPYSARERFAGQAVLALLARVGNPHQQLRCVHIAGSKGKGSVALMCEHLLQRAGARTGTFMSPHLQHWNERIRIDGRNVDTESLAHALDTLRPHLAFLDNLRDELSPTFFDLLTATALLMFARAGCGNVIIETGLGGSFDATNVITPLACCITSIEREHTDKLGDTVAAIANHKAGIIKPGIPVVTARYADAAQAVIERRAQTLNAPELRLGREWSVRSSYHGAGSQHIDYERQATLGAEHRHDSFILQHGAAHMAINAGLALTLLASADWIVDARALRSCALPARAQVIRTRPWIIVDAAHTDASLQALEDTLRRWPARERRFVISATRGKSVHALAALLSDADCVWITRADSMRSATAEELAALLEAEIPGLEPRLIEPPAAAFEQAATGLREDSMLCVCGSVYLAGAALNYWQPSRG